MNNLYNKIYEAINTGIQKALIIDDGQDQDVSIGWKNRNITAETDMLSYYVYQLLHNDNKIETINEIYLQIIEYHKNFPNKLYKVNNMKELADIYKEIDSANIFSAYENIDLTWINTSNIVMFIMNDYSEVPLHLLENINDVEYIKFNSVERCDHPLIIHKDLKVSPQMQWNTLVIPEQKMSYPDFDDSECINDTKYGVTGMYQKIYYDFNGYEHTYDNVDIIGNNRRLDTYPAIKYAKEQSTSRFQGYLPAFGEVSFLRLYTNIINYFIWDILKCKKPLTYFLSDSNYHCMWSSTEFDAAYAWRLIGYMADRIGKESNICQVIPFFKEK